MIAVMALKDIKKNEKKFSTFLTAIYVILYKTESDFLFYFISCYFIAICIVVILFFLKIIEL